MNQPIGYLFWKLLFRGLIHATRHRTTWYIGALLVGLILLGTVADTIWRLFN